MRTILVAFFVVVAIGSCLAEGEFAGFEAYSDAGLLLFAGRDVFHCGRICLWASSGQEIGFTAGPKVGPVSIGIGASASGLEVPYYNFDARLSFRVRWVSVESLNLYQKGRGETKDFFYFREVISFKDFPMGIIGENRKKVGENA